MTETKKTLSDRLLYPFVNTVYYSHRKDRYLRDWVFFTATISGILLAIAALSGLIGLASIKVYEKSCYDTASKLGLQADFGVFSGCNVNVDGTWIPLDNYMVNRPKP